MEGPTEFRSAVTAREQAKALAVAEFLALEMAGVSAGGDGEPATDPGATAAATPGVPDAPVVQVAAQAPPAAPAGAPTGGGPTGQARLAFLNLTGNTLVIAPGSAVISVTGGAQVKPGH